MSDLMERLAEIRNRGTISEISYQFCEFLRRVEPGCPDEVLLAGCLASQRKEQGDVCVRLADEVEAHFFEDESLNDGISLKLEEWITKLNGSKCVGSPGQARPLILDEGNRLYLHKYWKYEARLADNLRNRATQDSSGIDIEELGKELDILFGSNPVETDWQKVAAWAATRKKLIVISGGPGTGKTTTVVKILLLMARMGRLDHGALAAPTGKAASRLMESVNGALHRFKPEKNILDLLPDQAFTIHKLLGARRFGSEFRYNRDNPLPYELVVIDEASMIDLALMVKLVEALPDHAKLILLGDKDQLASVEAGAVMGSVCATNENIFSGSFINRAKEVELAIPENCLNPQPQPLTDNIVLLKKSYRFGKESGIGRLAAHILEGNSKETIQILDSTDFEDVQFEEYKDSSGFKEIVSDILINHFKKIIRDTEIESAMASLVQLGLLCVHRKGPLGANQVNRLAEQVLRQKEMIPATSEWYVGKPVMVTNNDYTLGLRNGELGITLRDEAGDLKVFFQESEGNYRSFYPSRLSYVETAYAITVHKSQGSEFDDIAVILPAHISKVSSREMLYTAVTRSRKSCTIIGNKQVLEGTVTRKIDRSSGLKDRLWGANY